MTSPRPAMRRSTAADSSSPRRWISEPMGSCPAGLAPESRISVTPCSSQRRSTRENVSAMCSTSVRGRSISLPPPLNDRCVGPSARAGSSCSSTIGQASLPRIAKFAYWIGWPAASAHPCAAMSAHPRTRPSGSSSPTPSVKESPIATNLTAVTEPAYCRPELPGVIDRRVSVRDDRRGPRRPRRRRRRRPRRRRKAVVPLRHRAARVPAAVR